MTTHCGQQEIHRPSSQFKNRSIEILLSQALLEITSGFHLTIRTKMTTTQPLKYNDWLAPEEISCTDAAMGLQKPLHCRESESEPGACRNLRTDSVPLQEKCVVIILTTRL